MQSLWQAIVLWDRATFMAINGGLQCRFLDIVMPSISDFGLGHIQILAILAAALLAGIHRHEIGVRSFWRDAWRALGRRRAWLAPLFMAWAFSGILSNVIKHNVARDRPIRFYESEIEAGRAPEIKVHVIPWRPPLEYHGFVSGHTATSVALAMAFTLIGRRRKWSRKWALASWCIALLVSFSRIYIADHWPLDVAAGALLGILCGVGAFALSREANVDARQDALPDAGSDANTVQRAAGSA